MNLRFNCATGFAVQPLAPVVSFTTWQATHAGYPGNPIQLIAATADSVLVRQNIAA